MCVVRKYDNAKHKASKNMPIKAYSVKLFYASNSKPGLPFNTDPPTD